MVIILGIVCCNCDHDCGGKEIAKDKVWAACEGIFALAGNLHENPKEKAKKKDLRNLTVSTLEF